MTTSLSLRIENFIGCCIYQTFPRQTILSETLNIISAIVVDDCCMILLQAAYMVQIANLYLFEEHKTIRL